MIDAVGDVLLGQLPAWNVKQVFGCPGRAATA
jgi:thiamine pyrophosphate-dependent acetolactate synthase large subunit-like protein